MPYSAIWTTVGLTRLAAADVSGIPVELTSIAVGDGGGSAITPSAAAVALTGQQWTDAISSIVVDPDNANGFIITGVIPEASGGFTVREIGVFNDYDELVIIASAPATYKTTPAEGSTTEMTVKVLVQYATASSVSLSVSPSVLSATRDYVDETFLPLAGGQMTGEIKAADSATAVGLGTATGDQLRILSRETDTAKPILIDQQADYTNVVSVQFRHNNGTSYLSLAPSGSYGGIIAFGSGGSIIPYSTATLSLSNSAGTAGASLIPLNTGTGTLGTETNVWLSVRSMRYIGTEKVVTSTATPAFDPVDGNFQRMILTGNVTSWTVATGAPGEVIRIMWIQNGLGPWTVAAPPANVILAGGAWTMTATINKRDLMVLVWDNTESKWYASVTQNY